MLSISFIESTKARRFAERRPSVPARDSEGRIVIRLAGNAGAFSAALAAKVGPRVDSDGFLILLALAETAT